MTTLSICMFSYIQICLERRLAKFIHITQHGSGGLGGLSGSDGMGGSGGLAG